MRGLLIGCGVVAILIVGGLVAGGLWIWNQAGPAITQGVQQMQKLEKELQKVVPDLKGLDFQIQTKNNKTTLKLSAPVPFDPSSGAQAEKIAKQMLEVIRQNLPVGIPATGLELRLFRNL
ncbi:MAG: hypothetical protein RLZZ156_2845, partial [Deinococcota bacterium]